jgi:exopolysaccharide production protein ExoZ
MTATNAGAPGEKASFHTIQVLRFIAALMVVITHSSISIQYYLDPSYRSPITGGTGVNLFFAISGFVMVVSSRKLVMHKSGWRIFLTQRLLRIVPLYWIVTTLKLVVLLVGANVFVFKSPVEFWHILKSYLFLPSLNFDNLYRPIVGVGWTLNLEMFFYVIFAACLFVKISRVMAASIVLIALAALPFLNIDYLPVIGFYTDLTILNFVWGMIVAKLYYADRKLNAAIAYPAILLGIAYLMTPIQFPISAIMNATLTNLSVFAVILGAVSVEQQLKGYLNAALRFFGDASYSLYLIHTSVVPLSPMLLHKLGIMNVSLALFCSLSLALVSAALVYLFVERPVTQKLKAMVKT